MVCSPRTIISTKKIHFSTDKILRIIKEVLRCNICLQIFNDPHNIKNCLHKFCKKCIEEYNRKEKKECAICRQSIETRRVMREDFKIKAIIKSLLPDVEKFNELEDKIFMDNLKSYVRPESNQNNNLNVPKPTINSKKKKRRISRESINELQRDGRRKVKNKKIAKKHNENNDINIPKEKNDIIEGEITQLPFNFGIKIKLICENTEGSDPKSNKIIMYTEEENITLFAFAKYVCLKKNLEKDFINKIKFYVRDEKKNQEWLNPTKMLCEIRNNFSFVSSVKLYYVIGN